MPRQVLGRKFGSTLVPSTVEPQRQRYTDVPRSLSSIGWLARLSGAIVMSCTAIRRSPTAGLRVTLITPKSLVSMESTYLEVLPDSQPQLPAAGKVPPADK